MRQNTALMNYPPGGERHQDSLFESSKASTNNPQIVRRQFGKNMALTSTTPNRQKMVLTQNQRQTEMLGAAVLGSKMHPSKMPAGTQPSSVLKGQSTKPGS